MTTPTETLIGLINDAAKESPVFTLAQLIKTSVLKHDAVYKQISIMSGTEFVLVGIREGKRSQFILEFHPVEETDAYKQMELLDNQIADVMPDIASFLSQAIGMPEMKWKDAKVKFLKAKAKEAEAAVEAVEEAKYEDNPQWGMF